MNRHIRLTSYIKIAAFVSFAGLFVLSVFAASPIVSKVDSASAATGTATPSTTELTIAGLSSVSSINVTPTNDGASFVSGGQINFSVSSNNYTGYAVELLDLVNEGKLINTEDSSLYLESVDDYYTAETFPTNKWGIKPSKYMDVANSSNSNIAVVDNTGDDAVFVPLTPSSTLDENYNTINLYGMVLDYKDIAGTSNYSIELGAKVDKSVQSGAYESTHGIYAIAHPALYSISFNKNTEDTVTNMPANQGTTSTSDVTIALSNLVPEREHYSFLGWCNVEPTNTNGTDSCTGTNPTTGATATVYNPNGDGTNLTYGLDHTVSNTNVTLYAMWQIDTFTCTKQYRLQNADGTWGNYVADGTETINYGGSCAYAKIVTDYKNSASGTNGAQASTTATNVTGDVTVSLDFYRNTYALTVAAGSNTSTPTGSGTYRWGQTVTITVTKASNVTCTTYAAPTWAQGTATGTIGTATNSGNVYTNTYVMPKSAATVTATSSASDVAQTITFKTSNATSITLDGNTKTNNQTLSINCGTYNITGVIPANYHFSSWGASAGAFGSASTLSTTYKVTGPATVTLTGAIDTYTQTTRYRYENADGTWGSWTTAETVTKDYGSSYSWSTSQIANFNSTAYQAASVASYTVTGTKTNDVSIYRKTFSCVINSRLQGTDGSYPSTYTSQVNSTVRYGGTCSWSTAATTTHQAASYSNTNVTANVSQNINVLRNLVTCNRRYRLQNADGSWGNYTSETAINAYYGGSCSYSKTVTDYKNAANGTNGAAASASASNVTTAQTLSLDFYRNTFTLTVSKGSNITAVSGGGTYRWGQTATVTATKATNVTCTTYGNPTWTANTGTAPAAGASSTYTMPKSNATVTAASAASNVAQTITFKTVNATNITLNGNTKTNNQTLSINCGTYNLTGTIPDHYHFTSWGATAGTVTAPSTLSTTYTVSGTATITLNAAIDTFTQTTRYRYENADGTWGSWTTAETVSKNYGASYSWSTSQIANFNSTAYQAASVASYTVTAAKTNDVNIYRNTFSCKINSGLQNTDGTYPSTYTSQVNSTVRYGGTCSWSVAATTSHQAASYSNTNVTANVSQNVNVPRKTFTCSKQYRLQNADGTWGNYTADGSATAYYGGSCAYAKTVTDYKNSASGTNGAQASTTATNVTSNQTLSLSFYRNTYTLTVTAGTNTSSATGGGTKRWGEAATVGVTKAADVTCTTYGTPTWTQSGTTGTFSATSGASVTFTMGKGNATVTATSAATNVAQTVTLSRGTGVASIKIGSTNYTAASVSLNCGTYNISGNYSNNYEFSSWARANGVAVTSTTTASTTMTVSGAGTLTLNAKQSKIYMQDVDITNCPTTRTLVYDNRDENSYYIQKLSIGNYPVCWMTQNLNLAGGTALTPSNTNITANYTLPASAITTSRSDNVEYVRNTTSTNCSNFAPCYSYYSYRAAKGGVSVSNTGNYLDRDLSYDICPRGWRLPTGFEAKDIINTYNTASAITGAPFYGVYSGIDGGGSQTGFVGNNGYFYGYFWLGSRAYTSSASALQIRGVRSGSGNSEVPPDITGLSTRHGAAIRCVSASFDNSIRTMQDLGSLTGTAKTNALNKMAVGANYTLADARDDKVYSITKLSNGTVWMTSNLNIDGGTTLTSATSNVASNYTLPSSSYSGWSSATTAYVYNAPNQTCESSGDQCNSYYSFKAAVAGTTPTLGSNATYDICPKGWRLPTRAEYNTLASSYSTIATIMATPWMGTKSGFMDDRGSTNGGEAGMYWTSTTIDTASRANVYRFTMSNFKITTEAMYPETGYAVRCILKQ